MLSEIEKAFLDPKRVIWVRMANGRWWQIRRNGATKTWKKRPNAFRIPIKAGLRFYWELNESSRIGMVPEDSIELIQLLQPNFLITRFDFDPNTALKK